MVVLKDISLCAIIRDEMMNPAGGITRFVNSHVPFVEEFGITHFKRLTKFILEKHHLK